MSGSTLDETARTPYAAQAVEVAGSSASTRQGVSTRAEAASRLESHGPNRLPRQEGVRLPGVRAPVPGLHADRAAGRRGGQPVRHRGRRDVGRAGRADRVQRGDRTAAGVEGRGERQGAGTDDEDHRPGPSGRSGRSRSTPRSSCPGDVVLVEAGNRVPADGRICVAATLEIEEAALTGESLPVGKSTEPVPGDDVPLGDRTCMAYMNTSVTRGRGEMIVTAHRHAHRDRPHRRPARQHRDGQDPAAEAARRPVEDHRDHRGRSRWSWSSCSGCSAASRSTPCSSPASRWPWPRSRPACRPWSPRCCPWAPARSHAATRSSSGCPRWRRSARPRRSARTRPAR